MTICGKIDEIMQSTSVAQDILDKLREKYPSLVFGIEDNQIKIITDIKALGDST